DEDIDYRIEDYLAALCYEKNNQKASAGKFYGQVASYPETKPGLKANRIVQVWALQKLGDEMAANELIQKKLITEKDESFKSWIMGLLNNSVSTDMVDRKRDANMLLLEKVQELSK
ncbi:MAG: hypothetical protein JWM28_2178, partial [Chitinophagaceae bacterium]|nr:hypothetical protein [Chitinophagaceae bacterium]